MRLPRIIDWAEIQATVWGPVRKKLKLCKVGWHSWSMGIHRHGFTMYRCSDCQKDTQYVPRWAR